MREAVEKNVSMKVFAMDVATEISSPKKLNLLRLIRIDRETF